MKLKFASYLWYSLVLSVLTGDFNNQSVVIFQNKKSLNLLIIN